MSVKKKIDNYSVNVIVDESRSNVSIMHMRGANALVSVILAESPPTCEHNSITRNIQK